MQVVIDELEVTVEPAPPAAPPGTPEPIAAERQLEAPEILRLLEHVRDRDRRLRAH